nr:serine/threonine-protein kinase-like protein At3g51990 [Arachis hypogaea]
MGYLSLSCRVESAVSTFNSLTPSPSFFSSSTTTTSKKQNNKEKEKPTKIQHFHYSDLEAATNGFSKRKLLGKESHGYVYKAVMVSSSSSFASAPEFIISDNEIDNEIDILSKIQSNNSKLPNWGRRVRLALQTAKEMF